MEFVSFITVKKTPARVAGNYKKKPPRHVSIVLLENAKYSKIETGDIVQINVKTILAKD